MKDNNLDDLIIDNMESKSNQGLKNLLSILALIIIVLIVAILLTKINIKNPQEEKMVFDQNYTQMIYPELKPTAQDNKTISSQKLSSVAEEEVQSFQSETIQEELKTEVAPETIAPIQETQPAVQQPIEPKPVAPKPATQHPIEPKPVAPKPATQQPIEPKPVAPQPAKPKPVAPQTTAQQVAYYIQVGSFKSQPSQNFLKVIKNHGYNYTIKQSSSNGTTVSKLLIGPYNEREEAKKALPGIRNRINKGAFLVHP